MDERLAPLREGLRGMYPGYFALVMATGIVSNAFFYLSHDGLSDVLFAITLVAFPILLACFVVRVLTWPRAVWRDLVDPRLAWLATMGGLVVSLRARMRTLRPHPR
jgi:tellurite resistance protein TehA-like permease